VVDGRQPHGEEVGVKKQGCTNDVAIVRAVLCAPASFDLDRDTYLVLEGIHFVRQLGLPVVAKENRASNL